MDPNPIAPQGPFLGLVLHSLGFDAPTGPGSRVRVRVSAARCLRGPAHAPRVFTGLRISIADVAGHELVPEIFLDEAEIGQAFESLASETSASQRPG